MHQQVGSLPLSHLGSAVVCAGGVLILNSGTEDTPRPSQEGLGVDGRTRPLISNMSHKLQSTSLDKDQDQ